MRKLVVLIISLSSFAISTAQEMTDSLYRAQYKYILTKISDIVSQTATYRNELDNVWNEAIYNHTYNGKRCDDFNEAVSSYLTERNLSFEYALYSIEVDKIKDQIKKLNKYTPSQKEAFDELIDLGIMVNEFHIKVDSPSGSYKDYSNETTDIYTEINRKLYELEIRYTN